MSSLIGCSVSISSSVTLYRDSDGNGPGKSVKGIFTCNHYASGKAAPIHIRDSNGDLGWIKCRETPLQLLSYPPIRVLEPM